MVICVGVHQSLGFALPLFHEFLGCAVIGDGPAQDLGLLGRDHAVHEPAFVHVTPLMVRPMAGGRVAGTAASGLAADFHALEQRTRAQQLHRTQRLADGGDAL